MARQAELAALGDRGRRALVDAFVTAWERADVPAMLELLARDARFTMPPLPACFDGRDDVGRFFAERVFETEWRLIPMAANGQLGFACYTAEPGSGDFRLGAGIPVEYLDTPANREISRLENAIDKVVVSDTLTADQTDPWRDTTRIVRRADAHETIAELKREPGGDILVFGSRTLCDDLLAAGLVDELHLMIGAVVLGDGTPAFATPPAAPLRLLDVRTFDGSDNVLIRYAAGS